MMDYSKLKVAIWGLGTHGGGLTSLKYMISKRASQISIIETMDKKKINEIILPLKSQYKNIQIHEQNKQALQFADLVIKNPAIPRHTHIITYANKIETDISLYFKEAATPSIVITGSKGKSSIATALFNILNLMYPKEHLALAGNITFSPLNLLIENKVPKKLILELSSFQLGDWKLVEVAPFNFIETMILSNLIPDHQNYYDSMKTYVKDKLFSFNHLSKDSLAILPYDPAYTKIKLNNNTLNITYYENEITLERSQVVFHSRNKINPNLQSVIHNDDGIYITSLENSEPKLILGSAQLPSHIVRENIAIVSATILFSKDKDTILPQNKNTWQEAFHLAHRKEFLGTYLNRKFINDSAATIPQAIQLSLMGQSSIHLICGGTNKNLNPNDLVNAIHTASTITLLNGSFTDLVIPLLKKAKINFFGPYDDLNIAIESALNASNEGEIILFSPGCASFEMFQHEFERGNKFKNIFYSLAGNS